MRSLATVGIVNSKLLVRFRLNVSVDDDGRASLRRVRTAAWLDCAPALPRALIYFEQQLKSRGLTWRGAFDVERGEVDVLSLAGLDVDAVRVVEHVELEHVRHRNRLVVAHSLVAREAVLETRATIFLKTLELAKLKINVWYSISKKSNFGFENS